MLTWPQDFATNFQFLLRWIHFLGGITWIGMLYFFNLVNVPAPEGARRGDEGEGRIRLLLTRTLWWFRWGAVVTWLSGFLYARLLRDRRQGDSAELGPVAAGLPDRLVGGAFAILSGVYRASVAGGALKDGRLVAVVVAIVVIIAGWLIASVARSWGASNRAIVDHGRRRDRHDHVHERLDDHLAAPEEDHRGDAGDRGERRRRRRPTSRSGRGARSWPRAPTPGCRSRCSSSWARPATSRSSTR